MKQLITLSLWRTPVTDAGLTHLKSLQNLQELYLRETAIQGTGLADLTSLRTVDLYGTRVKDSGLAQLGRLQKIEWLRLDATDITDDAVTTLTMLRGLQWLSVRGTRLTPKGVERLRITMPKCTIEANPKRPETGTQ